ncbi:MAG: malic enzyme-like NAD(P)-binding protein [Acidobacteriota bacterium]
MTLVLGAHRRFRHIGGMSEHVIDTVLRLRVEHRTGQLARLTSTIADAGGLIGDISTIRVGETATLRDVTIETIDEDQTRHVVECVGDLDGVEVMNTTDRVFEAHRGGKLHSTSRVHLDQLSDLRSIYTPGVARVSRAIVKDPSRAWDLCSVGNSVGIFTNGSRVLGLGNIGPLASMPVMEGKAVLYDKLIDISATPILVDTLDPMEFVDTVMRISHTFGGIHLEDIRIPDCYVIEDDLRRQLKKPVMHDDQHGTAIVTLAALINACKITGRDLKSSKVGMIGLGAAGSAIARLALSYGVGAVLVTDVSADAISRVRRAGAVGADMATIIATADIVIAATGRPGLIDSRDVRPGQVIFALTNPKPEINPSDARAAGAAFAGDGRSINNALAFPGLFRGALAARSSAITTEMLIAAAETIASLADPGEVVPSCLDRRVHQAVAIVVAETARTIGLAGTAEL